MKTWAKLLFALLILCRSGHAQGFINLDFESAHLSSYGAGPASVPALSAVPGWTVYYQGNPYPYILYNAVSLGGAAVILEGTNADYPLPPIQGNWFVHIQGGWSNGGSAGIGQTGQIPIDAQTLVFWGSYENMIISFSGQPLTFAVLGGTPNYTIYGADISAYAGQIGELLFTGLDGSSRPGPFPYGGGGFIDNIQFSPSPVPEPSNLALGVLGGLLLLKLPRWRKAPQN